MLTEYALLFLSAFIAATVLPFYSEAFLYVLLQSAPSALWPVLIATAGNVLGSCVNWWLGMQAARMAPAQPGHESSRRLDRARAWYNRYGYWSLLASWVPIVGDPLTLVAGAMREPFWRFLAIVTLAKSGRYAALAAGLVASGLHG